jgi:hypothetical protein
MQARPNFPKPTTAKCNTFILFIVPQASPFSFKHRLGTP